MIKIAFFDIDGTLVDMDTKVISSTMIQTLQKLKEKNIKICIATGRPPKAIPIFPQIEFDAYLAFNGSYCFTKEEVIFSNPIPQKDIQKIIENGKEIGKSVLLCRLDGNGANGTDDDLEEYMAISKQDVPIKENFEEYCKEDVYQIIVSCNEAIKPLLMKDANQSKMTAWWDKAADIIPASSGKGIAVEKMLAYYGFNKEEAIAFGDGTNDIDMFLAVGCGVAMANATQDLKEVATEICPHVKEEGITQYCKAKGWI